MNTETKWLDAPDCDGLWVSLFTDGSMSNPRWTKANEHNAMIGLKYARIQYEMPEPPKREFEPIQTVEVELKAEVERLTKGLQEIKRYHGDVPINNGTSTMGHCVDLILKRHDPVANIDIPEEVIVRRDAEIKRLREIEDRSAGVMLSLELARAEVRRLRTPNTLAAED